MSSRDGRHTATASSWVVRAGAARDADEALKLVVAGKVVLIAAGGRREQARTRVGYPCPKAVEVSGVRHDVQSNGDRRASLKGARRSRWERP